MAVSRSRKNQYRGAHVRHSAQTAALGGHRPLVTGIPWAPSGTVEGQGSHPWWEASCRVVVKNERTSALIRRGPWA